MNAIRKAAIASLVLIFLVIIAGSVVRTTGSGMGCPDWPKCYGHLIPPTNQEQVTWHPNTHFNKGQMIVKDDALWSAKSNFTSADSYDELNWEKYTQHDYAIFNAKHTWIEYVNRLLGAASGVPVLLLFVFSLLKIRSKPLLFLLSAGTLFMLGYEAWLGKLVVDGNLVPNAISKHMFGSLLIVGLLVTIISKTLERKRIEVTKSFKILVVISFLLVTAQILLGTQVREQIDEIAIKTGERGTWISLLDMKILIHRSFSILILLSGIWLFWRNWKDDYALWSVGAFSSLIVLEIAVGVVLFYLDMPKIAQPVHLWISTAMFSFVFWAMIRTKVN